MTHHINLSWRTRTLHWAVALIILPLTLLGLIMTSFELWSLYDLHKSLGILSLILILPRVVLRIKEGWPTPIGTQQRWKLWAAKSTHWSILILTILMPLSGMLYSGASGNGFSIFSMVIVPENISDNGILPYSARLSVAGQTIHNLASYALISFLALHIGGALYHHFKLEDETLTRMVGKHD